MKSCDFRSYENDIFEIEKLFYCCNFLGKVQKYSAGTFLDAVHHADSNFFLFFSIRPMVQKLCAIIFWKLATMYITGLPGPNTFWLIISELMD